jgi:hypothetical protein
MRPPMNKEWRPVYWNNPSVLTVGEAYERGASAMLEVRDKDWIAWGDGKCPHKCGIEVYPDILCAECPECWAERKKKVTHE